MEAKDQILSTGGGGGAAFIGATLIAIGILSSCAVLSTISRSEVLKSTMKDRSVNIPKMSASDI